MGARALPKKQCWIPASSLFYLQTKLFIPLPIFPDQLVVGFFLKVNFTAATGLKGTHLFHDTGYNTPL